MSQPSASEQNACLNLALRQDLEMHPAMPDVDGSPGWILSDPVQHRYFRINEETYRIFALWLEKGAFGEALLAFCEERGEDINDDDITRLIDFAHKGNLIDSAAAGDWQELAQKAKQQSAGKVKRLLSHYLFFKVPLFQPQGGLTKAMPFVRPLLSRPMAIAIALLSFYALYLVSRQWDSFIGSASVFLSPQGAMGFLLVLVLLKVVHELGHAFMAMKYGCRVPVMGVAFMLMTPLLYTDVSDGWKLPDKRKRMLISGAGILVETAVAAISTLLWAMMPDGGARTILFMVASSAWVSSLAINLNPCMRFDGYYLLSDWLGVDNLQPRSFALAKWQLRQWLLRPGLPVPEPMPHRLMMGLIGYAFAVWLYRLILFATIALAVYHFTFKLLGIVLFAIEIGLLILLPLLREMAEWRKSIAARGAHRRFKITIGVAGMLFALLLVPLPGRVSVPAVLVGSDLTRLYTERAGRVSGVHVARFERVAAGQPLLSIDVPELENNIEAAKIRLGLLKARLDSAGDNIEELAQSLVLKKQYASMQTEISGLSDLQETMQLRAAAAGSVVQMAPDLHVGRWVKKGELLAILSQGKAYAIKGYVAQSDIDRLYDDAKGRFIPENLQLPSVSVQMQRLAPANSEVIDLEVLASVNGGAIVVSQTEGQSLRPQVAQYRIDFEAETLPFQPRQMVRGLVQLPAKPESFLASALEKLINTLIRESGF